MRFFLLSLFILSGIFGCSSGPTEQQIVNDVTKVINSDTISGGIPASDYAKILNVKIVGKKKDRDSCIVETECEVKLLHATNDNLIEVVNTFTFAKTGIRHINTVRSALYFRNLYGEHERGFLGKYTRRITYIRTKKGWESDMNAWHALN